MIDFHSLVKTIVILTQVILFVSAILVVGKWANLD